MDTNNNHTHNNNSGFATTTADRKYQEKVTRSVLRHCSRAGLVLRPGAATRIGRHVAGIEEETRRDEEIEAIVSLLNKFKDREDKDTIGAEYVDEDIAVKALEAYHNPDKQAVELERIPTQGVEILNVFKDVKRLSYDSCIKRYVPITKKPTLFGQTGDLHRMYRDRLDLAFYRLAQHEQFKAVGEKSLRTEAGLSTLLTSVEALRGSSGPKLTLGMLVQQDMDCFSLEGVSQSVQVDLLHTASLSGYICEDSVVLAEGEMQDDVFVVNALSLPPAESALRSDRCPNFFGGSFVHEDRALYEKKEATELFEPSYVVCSDVHLDSMAVLLRLERLFQVFSEAPILPTAFILMGDFSSRPFYPNEECMSRYVESFKTLRALLEAYSVIAERSRLILLAGPGDPGCDVLPRLPLLEELTGGITKRFPNVVLASNPLRLRHFHREIVLFRQDIADRFRQLTLIKPSPQDEESGTTATTNLSSSEYTTSDTANSQKFFFEYVRSLAHAGHLWPFSAKHKPIFWNFDHTLSIFPLPDAVLIGDNGGGKKTNIPRDNDNDDGGFYKDCLYEDCLFSVVESFAKSNGAFYVYYPRKSKGELSFVTLPPQ